MKRRSRLLGGLMAASILAVGLMLPTAALAEEIDASAPDGSLTADVTAAADDQTGEVSDVVSDDPAAPIAEAPATVEPQPGEVVVTEPATDVGDTPVVPVTEDTDAEPAEGNADEPVPDVEPSADETAPVDEQPGQEVPADVDSAGSEELVDEATPADEAATADEEAAPADGAEPTEEAMLEEAAKPATSLNGVDISGWNTAINIAKLSADFVIVKASEYHPGSKSYTYYTSRQPGRSQYGGKYASYKEMADAVLKAGKLLGFYHFATNPSMGASMTEQAQGFIDAVKPYLGKAVLFLDWEDSSYSTVESHVSWAKEWLDYVREKTGTMPLIYMNKNCSNAYNWSSVVDAGYELWGAQYLYRYEENAGAESDGYVKNPDGKTGWGKWGTPAIYQYSSTNEVVGSGEIIDVNKYYGTKASWLTRCAFGEAAASSYDAAKLLANNAVYSLSPLIKGGNLVSNVTKSHNVELGSTSSKLTGYWRVKNLGDGYYSFYSLADGKPLTFVKSGTNNSNVNTVNTSIEWKLVKCLNGAYALVPKGFENLRLDVSGGKTATVGANLQIHTKNNSASQRFFFTKQTGLTAAKSAGKSVSAGIYVLTSAKDGTKALEIKDGSDANKANAQLNAANGSLAQSFKFTYVRDGLYTITSFTSGKVLEAAGGGKKKDTNVQQYKSNSTLAQYWYIKKESGFYGIYSALSGLKLDVAGGKMVNGTNVRLWNNNSTAAQRFTLTEDVPLTEAVAAGKTVSDGIYTLGANVGTNLVVDIKGGSKKSGGNVQAYRSNNSLAQKFQLSYEGNGIYRIMAGNSGMMLAVQGASKKSGANVEQATSSSGNRAQMWYLVKSGSSYQIKSLLSGKALAVDGTGVKGDNICVKTSSSTAAQQFKLTETELLAEGTYTFSSALGNYRLSVKDASSSRGGNVQIYTTSSNPAQKWVLSLVGKGIYLITNANSGLALDVANGSVASGANVRQWSQNGSQAQQWTISLGSNGYMIIKNVKSGLALTVQGGVPGNEVNVRQETVTGSNAQLFTAVKS